MNDLLTDEDMKNEGLKKDLETILKAIPSYMDIMLMQTMMLAQLFKMGRSPKRITAKNIMTLVQFSQNLMQGGWLCKDSYRQLPYFGEKEAKAAHNYMQAKKKNSTFFQYCMLPKEERQATAE